MNIELFKNSLNELSDELEYEQFVINNLLIPVSKSIINNSNAEIVYVSLSQYYNDDATDEVHIRFFISNVENSNWDDLFNSSKNVFYISLHNENYDDYDEYFDTYDLLKQSFIDVFGSSYTHYSMLLNDTFNTVFSKYCIDGINQMDDEKTKFTPFLIITKNNIRNIGKIKRIWK